MLLSKIDWELLDELSYRTHLNKSLKNTLRKFDVDVLFNEINTVIQHYIEKDKQIVYTHRIKAIQSCALKYQKYYPNTQVEKAFNDILGIRLTVENYDFLSALEIPSCVKKVDMQNGKAKDDGYRAVHLYYQKDHFHYPIEIQLATEGDQLFNEWMHTYFYKYVDNYSVGLFLRRLYEQHIINTEEDFRKEMSKYVLFDCKKI